MASGSGFRIRFPVDLVRQEMNDRHLESPKRTARIRTKPKKYGDFVEELPVKHASESQESSENDESFEVDCLQKPTALFSNGDVEGHDIFKFKSRHTKQDLQNKVKSAISNSPRVAESSLQKLKELTPKKTPRKSKGSVCTPLANSFEATPKHVNKIIKRRIIQEVDSDSADGDFSGSSSDEFVPALSDNETDQSTSSDDDSKSEEEEAGKKQANKVQIVKSRDSKVKSKDSEYVVTPDSYFMMNSSKKIATSDHTLAKLKNLNLNENVEEDIQISHEHKEKILELSQSYEQLFNKWLYVLSEDFNIILYGIGSKRSVLHQFQMQHLQDFPCVVVNGFFPSLTIKSILESIVVELLENSSVPSNIGDIVNLIDSQLTESGADLFIIIHNIDGMMLRNGKAQSMLASISQIKNVHTIATIDHINAPLLWDHSKLSKFNFTWWDVTTFLPYSAETSFENSLMSHRTGALQLSSLRSVYQALTTNAKGIFNIIIQYQLDNHKQPHYQGLSFKDLYSKSREQFLVSSDLALRAQLTEFLDHRLVKMKRSYDGNENLVIPIENMLLQQFLDQQNS